jgi:endonuclease III-like uncharacterized protein
MASRKIVNKNVSSTTKVSSETLAQLKRLRLVNRFYNLKQQHGNQRAHAWNFFGYLFHDTAGESLFSITGITKNSRRSSLAPYRLNKLTFVHDNYHLFFPIGK